nr:targeting protein for Xklp2-B-like isoform X2 [Cherax quadricarinatus]XP_053648843.1 targeting protein for Xklp2-B-like isoform X2 [Cherax quadricarinatus]XP_053648852.1 targeting protein for Xklp2-B-like isoform X2 [Cherax quadricarinatus]XP_053648860.1 targeting protein for Xklp2-B-like isoform X2 [Cherax quadricarinatus]XP_053648868.1 targeting protein for Xklp2-B-like isoform X2 [Cherax quadricarinatus]XP_053648877.1 targeting protein for Xklp2-B-like isoform X2 [Cherax quadricarinatus]
MANATTDDLYEYDAPKLYFDFNERENIEVDESYFDRSTSPKTMEDGEKGLLQKEPDSQSPSSLGVTVETSNPNVETPRRQRTSAVADSSNKENRSSLKKSGKRNSLSVLSSGVGVRQSPRLAAIAKVQNPPVFCTSKAIRRSSAARLSLRKSSSSHNFKVNKVQKNKANHKSSAPRTGVKGLSPQDQKDLKVIAVFRQKMAENKKKCDPVTSGVGKSTKLGPTKPQEFHFATDSRLRNPKKNEPEKETKECSSKSAKLEPTVPKEFHFATDSRIKNQVITDESEAKDFTRSLRSGASADNTEAKKGPTIPQPFKLTETRKGKTEDGTKFVSIAELNLKFHTKTPQRFRSKRAGSHDDLNLEGKKKNNLGVTIPHTPNLCTRSRSRQVNYPTREEMEEKEFEEAQRHAFKAHPINKKVLEAPAGYQVEKKNPTVPEPFDITDSKKAQKPLSFKFQEMCDKLGESSLSLASLPHGGIPSKWDKTSTKIQPFSFDLRDKTKEQLKQEKIQKVLEEEKQLAEFHAHPMPIFDGGVRGVPPKKPPTPTRPEPFALKVDERGAAKKEQYHKHLEEEAQQEKKLREFHARSDAVLHKQPFIPDKSKKPLTDVSGFTLNTEVRAVDRNEYELHRKRKEDEILAAKREREERQAAEELEEIARLRREAVHKANPVRKYKPVVIDHTQNLPTIPISPNFATEQRLKSRSKANSANSTLSSATFMAE